MESRLLKGLLTDDFELQRLVFKEGLAVTLTLVLLSTKVFHCLVIEKAISMDATSYLKVNDKCSCLANRMQR